MNCLIAALLLVCAIAAQAQDPAHSTEIGCSDGNPNVEDYHVTVDRRVYPDTTHVDHIITIELTRKTTTYSITCCFDTAQCVTAGFSSFTYPNVAPNAAANVSGLFCVDIVPPKELTVEMEAGSKIHFHIHTYGAATAGEISLLYLNGNGVVEAEKVVETPAADPSAYCGECDGGYTGDFADCHNFYRCTPSGIIKFQCAANLHWDSALKTCNYPDPAGCYTSGALGMRRYQCKDQLGNCPAAVDNGDGTTTAPYTEFYLVSRCGHSDTPQPTAAP